MEDPVSKSLKGMEAGVEKGRAPPGGLGRLCCCFGDSH